MIAKGGELFDPVGFDFVEPVAEILQGFAAEVVDADAGVFFFVMSGSKLYMLEDRKMADGRMLSEHLGLRG